MKPTATSLLHRRDLELARLLNAGDDDAFRCFFEANYDRVYRFALARLRGDHSITEDVVQQSFTNALDRISSYRGEAQLFTWLCTICRNLIIDWQRKNANAGERIVFFEDSPEIRAVVETFQAPASDDPQSEAQREEAIRLVQAALDGLPVEYGNILEWRYIEGYSALELADRLNTSVDAVNSLSARAKRAFAEIYRPMASALLAP